MKKQSNPERPMFRPKAPLVQPPEVKPAPEGTGSYAMYDSGCPVNRIAWSLCQYLDDDAPLQWSRYRGVARFIASNDTIMADLQKVRIAQKPDLMNELLALRNELMKGGAG